MQVKYEMMNKGNTDVPCVNITLNDLNFDSKLAVVKLEAYSVKVC